MANFDIRAASVQDIPALQEVLAQTDLFPPEMLPEFLTPALEGKVPDLWYVAEVAGRATGLVMAVPEPMTEGTWNMRALAVRPDQQGRGQGAALVAAVEAGLREQAHRLLVVDTSGTPAFDLTRQFYRQNGYHEAARLPGFWGPGDDKVTFWKTL